MADDGDDGECWLCEEAASEDCETFEVACERVRNIIPAQCRVVVMREAEAGVLMLITITRDGATLFERG